MRMNAERQNQENYDVYADLATPYSATDLMSETPEFSLEEVQEKLGRFSEIEEPVASEETGVDIKPTQQTLAMSYQRNYESHASAAPKFSTKVKVAAICYVAVVLLLVLGISLTSVAVSGVFAQVTQLTSDYTEVADQIAALDEALGVEDFDALQERAAELGYIDASKGNANTAYFTELETRPAQEFNVETNWFDEFCDWLCGVFGG